VAEEKYQSAAEKNPQSAISGSDACEAEKMMTEARAPSIYQKKSGAWTVDFQDPSTQTRHRRQVKNKRDALTLRDEIAKKLENGQFDFKDKRFVAELMNLHISRCPDTRVANVAHRFKSFCNHFGAWDIRKIATEDLRHWMDNILTPAHNNGSYGHIGLCDKSKKKARDQLNSFFRWCHKEKFIANNPCIDLKYREDLKKRRRPLVYYTTDELKILIAKVKEFSPHLYPISLTELHTGARLGETTYLEWDDIDFATGKIRFKKTKNGKTRWINMSPQLVEMFKNMPRNSNWVFLGMRGDRMTENVVKNLIKRFHSFFPYHEQYGEQKKFGNHCLRHSFAYNSLQKGAQMYELQATMGHSSIKLTVDLYGHFETHSTTNPSPYDF
jgi:integrase